MIKELQSYLKCILHPENQKTKNPIPVFVALKPMLRWLVLLYTKSRICTDKCIWLIFWLKLYLMLVTFAVVGYLKHLTLSDAN